MFAGRMIRIAVVTANLAGLPGAVAGATTAPATPQDPLPTLKEVVVVFKTHFDIGYTDFARNVLEYYRTTMIDRALAVCEATRSLPPEQQFVWTLPGWPLAQIVGPQQTPERHARVVAAMREGLFVWHALPATTHTESLELEDLVRGMRFSSGLSRSLGQPLPRDAKMTDVPSHAWVLPTIFARAGVEFLHLGCNRASTPPETPLLFEWEGPDGSRVLTMLTAGYGSGLVPPKDWPHATWLALIHTGDNAGPPKPEQVKELLARAAKELPGVKVRFGRLSDFADAIRREKAALPVVRADMPDTWIHGLLSMPIEAGEARRVRPRIAALESLNTLLHAWGVEVPGAKDAVAAAYEQSLLYGEHTWGIDVKKFDPRRFGKAWEDARAKGTYARLEASWAEHGGYIRRAGELVAPALDANVQALARAVAADGVRVVVFNPLPWERDDAVAVALPAGVSELKDAESGEVVPVEMEGGTARFVARRVPPMGYRTYVPGLTTSPGDRPRHVVTPVLDNPFLWIHLDDKRGTIASIRDKRTRQELARERDGRLPGQYLYERFDADDVQRFVKAYAVGDFPWIPGDFGKPGLPPAIESPHTAASPSGFERVRALRGRVAATLTMKAIPSEAVPHLTSLTVRLYHELPWVDLEWQIEDKKPTPWPEAGWLCLPLAVKEPTFRLARLGAIVDPAKDIQRASNHHVFCLNGGLTVTDPAGAGVGICPLGSPLVSLSEPGLWRFSREFVPTEPIVYINLFNNQWSTNFPQWIEGSWYSRVRLWAVSKDDPAESLIKPSWEARQPYLAGVFDGPAGLLPPTRAGLKVSRPGVLVTAFGPNPDGAGTLLRLWEQAGGGGPCVVELPAAFAANKVQPCDLRGRPQGAVVPIRDGKIEVEVARFAPVSLILEGDSQ